MGVGRRWSPEGGEDLGGDGFDDFGIVGPGGVIRTRMVKDEVGEAQVAVAARKIGERRDAGEWSFVGVAGQVDPGDLAGGAANDVAVFSELFALCPAPCPAPCQIQWSGP